VLGFGMGNYQDSKHSQGALFSQVKAIASATAQTDGDRLELVSLVGKAEVLWP